MILEGTNGKRLSCRKINKFADLFITNMTVDKFNSYAQVEDGGQNRPNGLAVRF